MAAVPFPRGDVSQPTSASSADQHWHAVTPPTAPSSAATSDYEQVPPTRPSMQRQNTLRGGEVDERSLHEALDTPQQKTRDLPTVTDARKSARTTRSATLPNVADPSEAFRTPTTSLLTATLRVIPPERRDRTISEDAEMSWPPSSTDDDRERPARRPSATLIPPFQPSGVSTDDEDGVTAHPRGIAITRATTMGRPSVAASTSDLMSPRRRRRGVRAGPRASSPASYPRRRELHGTGRRGGVESEPEDLSTAAAADDAFLALIDATKELVRLSASSSRPFTNDLPVASTAAVPADAIKARVASDHSTPSGGTLSAADLPSSFMAHSSEDALSPKPRSPPKEKERAMPTSSWMSWLYVNIELRLWQFVGIAGLLVGTSICAGLVVL